MRRLLAAVLAAVVLLPAVGCAARPAEPESGKLRVVCSLFPYYDFVRAPVNSFEFQPCGRTPQVGYLLCLLRHRRGRYLLHLVSIVYGMDYQGI